jgi:hypothetical protein
VQDELLLGWHETSTARGLVFNAGWTAMPTDS